MEKIFQFLIYIGRLLFEGVFVGIVVGIVVIPVSLSFARIQGAYHSLIDADYAKLDELERKLEIAVRSDSERDIPKVISEIKKLEKKGVFGSAYTLSTIYSYGINEYMKPDRILCTKYKIKAIENMNASALLLSC